MNQIFENLPMQKQDAILNALYACFAKTGYEKTSVADIATEAGVSKASLFHYFGNKQQMYHYAYKTAVQVIMAAVMHGLSAISTDFFERITQAQALKIQVAGQYPTMFDFLSASVVEESPEVGEILHAENADYRKVGFDALFEGVAWEKFRPEVDKKMAADIVTWVGNGFVQANMGLVPTKKMGEEVAHYMKLLKQAFYKEEYLP